MQIAVHHILEAAELGDAASRIGAARGAATSSGNITGYQQILRDLHSNSHLLFVIRMIMEKSCMFNSNGSNPELFPRACCKCILFSCFVFSKYKQSFENGEAEKYLRIILGQDKWNFWG